MRNPFPLLQFQETETPSETERRGRFLRDINLVWLVFGIATVGLLPFFPEQRPEFVFLIALIFPTCLITYLLNRRGKTRLAGVAFTLSANLGFYTLFAVIVGELGAYRAFETETPVLMLIGLAILFAGAFVQRWAAPVLAALNSILFVALRLTIAPTSQPRPSVLVFWWVIAATIWLYEGTLQDALRRSRAESMGRKQTEAELHESEDRYRKLIDSARDVIFTISTEGMITSLNPSFETFLRWPRAEWIGRPYSDLIAAEDVQRAQGHFERVRRGQSVRALRVRMHTRTSEVLVVEMNISPEFKGGQVVGLLGIARDMTEEQRADDLLQANEKHFRALIENSSDAISLTNRDGVVTYASPSSARILGYSPEERKGRSGFELMHPDDQISTLPQYEDMLQHPGKTVIVQYRIRRKDGAWRWIEAVARNLLEDPSVGAVVNNYRDITERKTAELELKRYAENNATMTQLSHQILTRLNLEQVYEHTREAVQKMMPCDAFSIALLDETTLVIQDVYLWDHDGRRPAAMHLAGEGLTDSVISSGRALLVNNRDDWNVRSTHAKLPRDAGRTAQSILAVPLLETNGRRIGMISTQANSPNAFTDEDERLLATVANEVSQAIRNAKLFDDLQRSNSELSLAYDATIEGWSHAMDLRDKETEGHTLRVTDLTLTMAKSMGVAEDVMVHIRRGALLHDIGKIGVPDSILYKPEDLTEEEWVIMRKHPIFAHEMLSPIPYLRAALDIPYCHHEKWDGSGYPRGLKGEEIPLVARIFAIVDVWDALTSDRPYRPAWTKEKSLEYIKEQSGKYFDPKVVPAFLDLIKDLPDGN